MKFRTPNTIVAILVSISLMLIPTFSIAQDEQADNPDVTNTTNENNKGLGTLFARALKDLLKDGQLFVPNGQTAQPVSQEGQEDDPDAPQKFKLNFNNAQIDQVLKFLSDMKKKVVLKSDEVQGNFTIMNPNEVTAEEAMNIIDAAFSLKGITYMETDQMILVLPIEAAKKMGVDVKVGADQETGARVTSTVIDLKYASPSQLRESLSELMPDNANVIADDRTGSMIITDTASNITRLEKIIRQLDKPGIMEGTAIRVFKLRYLSASEMSRDLDDLLENIVASKMTGGDDRDRRRNANVEVMGDRSTNSLIISAPKDAIDEVAEFIDRLDVSSTSSIQNETITLKNGEATEIAQGLNQILQNRSSQNYRPTVVADQRTNTVIISAYPEDVQSIKEILETLDEKKTYEKITKVYPLENADAIILKEMLMQLIGGEESSSNRRNYYSYYYSRRGGQDEEDIKIIEDQRLNALVVTAKPADIEMVSTLIEQLDQPLPQSKEEPRVFPVKYSRASDLAYLVNELFTETQTGGGFFSSFREQTSLTGLSGKVRAIADSTTNSIIVIAGTPRAFGVVEGLIKKLDRKAPEFGTTMVYKLEHADATILTNQLTQLFEEQGGQGGNQGFFWYMNQSSNQNQQINNLIGNVRIVAETRTNSLLVTTNSQYFDPIAQLVKELDQEIAQMLIEILIVEITNMDTNELGIDWPDNVPITVEGNFDGPLTGINQDRVALLSRSSFTTILNALGQSNKTNLVARPNILTGDNQTAYVEIITQVPVIGESTVTGTGLNTQEIEFRDSGLKLTVRPHINDATTVTIDVDLETGQVLDRLGLQVGESKIPAFAKRVVRTKLTVHDEETAVLSGVIDTNYSDTETGIPGLRHIPLVGYLFKSKGKEVSKTELLTFITPYILEDMEDRQRILERQSSRIELYETFGEEMDDIKVKVGKDLMDNPKTKSLSQ